MDKQSDNKDKRKYAAVHTDQLLAALQAKVDVLRGLDGKSKKAQLGELEQAVAFLHGSGESPGDVPPWD